jgi:A/G-specific adenine glycosylase
MEGNQPSLPSAARVAVREWYAPRSRLYAWRRGRRSAYRTLVSEVMLQQTQAARVEPLFVAFMRLFPDPRALAAAPRADVLRAWAGLGYNRRAVALHETARIVVAEHGGRIPLKPDALRRLPGVGPHTAAAIMSIAGGEAYAAKEVNVRRVVGRAGLGTTTARVEAVDTLAANWLDRDDPGAWNQALMDLGREHCRATPRCGGCPMARWCRARRAGIVAHSPATPQGRFEGSARQVRGRIVDVLRTRPSAGPAMLARATGCSEARVSDALAGLVRDGVVDRTGRSYALAAG